MYLYQLTIFENCKKYACKYKKKSNDTPAIFCRKTSDSGPIFQFQHTTSTCLRSRRTDKLNSLLFVFVGGAPGRRHGPAGVQPAVLEFPLVGGLKNLETAHQRLVHGHHRAGVVELACVRNFLSQDTFLCRNCRFVLNNKLLIQKISVCLVFILKSFSDM